MPKVICPNCGNEVRLQGLGGICPHCDGLVMAVTPKPDESDEKSRSPSLPPTSQQYSLSDDESRPVDLLHDPAGPGVAEDQFAAQGVQSGAPIQPPTAQVQSDEEYAEHLRLLAGQRKDQQQIWMIIGLSAGATLLLLLVAIILALISQRAGAPPVTIVQTVPSQPATPILPDRAPAPLSPAGGRAARGPATQVAEASPAPASKPATMASSQPAPPAPHAELAKLRIQPQKPGQALAVTDEQTVAAIKRGLEFLLVQFSSTRLKDVEQYDPDTFAGLDALAVYALLHASATVEDQRISPQSELVNNLLDRLKEFPMTGIRATYSRSLRISALTVLNRPQDRATIEGDLQWLLKSTMKGAFTYSMPPAGTTHDYQRWDNSNSQYGALGVWAAAEAGYPVPASFWNEVEWHWTGAQAMSGGWGYGPNEMNATLAMSAAGITMLFVARDQPIVNSVLPVEYVPLSKPIERALEWMDEGNHAIDVTGHRGYTVYALERAGLASGYKYFGTHDWYLELAAKLLNDQAANGGWGAEDGPVAETAFSLLFLARGRHPVFIAKLKFDGAWNNRPRDASAFTRFASYQLERPVNWEVADIARDFWQWSDASALLITSNHAPTFGPREINKLRGYVQAGGMIFLNTEQESAEFNQFAAELAKALFPDYPFDPIPPDHPIYSSVFTAADKLPLRGVSNGVRLLLVHSPTDLTRYWQTRPAKNQRASSELGMNIVVYATGRRDLRNRLVSSYIPKPSSAPIGIVPVARLQYQGNWNPEPGAWTRASNILQTQTGVALEATETPVEALDYLNAPIAHLTGTAALRLTDVQMLAMRRFVTRGGTLMIDACGGSKTFADSVESNLLPALFPQTRAVALTPAQGILAGNSEAGMLDLAEPQLRADARESATRAQMLILNAGAGRVVFSRLDLTSGLAGADAIGIAGYRPQYCSDFLRNLILWTINHLPG